MWLFFFKSPLPPTSHPSASFTSPPLKKVQLSSPSREESLCLTFHGDSKHTTGGVVAGVACRVRDTMSPDSELVWRLDICRRLAQFGLGIIIVKFGVIADLGKVKGQSLDGTFGVSASCDRSRTQDAGGSLVCWSSRFTRWKHAKTQVTSEQEWNCGRGD